MSHTIYLFDACCYNNSLSVTVPPYHTCMFCHLTATAMDPGEDDHGEDLQRTFGKFKYL